MAGSFQVVIAPLKILAAVVAVEHQVVDAVEVVGDGDRAEDQRQVPGLAAGAAGLGRCSACSALSAESEPAKSICPR